MLKPAAADEPVKGKKKKRPSGFGALGSAGSGPRGGPVVSWGEYFLVTMGHHPYVIPKAGTIDGCSVGRLNLSQVSVFGLRIGFRL